jgi:hypothetical protein
MAEHLLITRERTILHDLMQLAGDRAATEQEITSTFRARNESAATRLQEDLQKIASQYQSEKEATENEFDRVQRAAAETCESESRAAKIALAETRHRGTEQFDQEKATADTARQETVWTINTLHEADKTKADSEFVKFQQKMAAHLKRIETLRRDADILFADWVADGVLQPGPCTNAGAHSQDTQEDSLRHMKEHCSTAEATLLHSRKRFTLKLAKGKRFLALVAFLGILAMLPAVWSSTWYYWLAATTSGTLAIAVIGYPLVKGMARLQVQKTYQPLCTDLAEAEAWCKFCVEQGAAAHKKQLAKSQNRHDTAVHEAEAKYQGELTSLTQRRDTAVAHAEEQYRSEMDRITRQQVADARAAQEKYPRLLAELERHSNSDTRHAEQQNEQELLACRRSHDDNWQGMTVNWRQGLERLQAEASAIAAECRQLFPPWSDLSREQWVPPAAFPPVLRFGELDLPMAEFPNGISRHEDLQKLTPSGFTLPALLTFPDQSSLLIRVDEGGRPTAEQLLQLILFRLLTAVPPAKVRFVIIDPVGLGQSFAVFMHLADHDESLVASRIWTEQHHIEQRLADLTAHMETVIQKYLRNQYRTIEEYNVQAGEVAEPFRFLVVANFPVNFSLEAARRLVSVAASGARCGVHTLVTIDTKHPLPQGFQLEDLERHAVIFACGEGGLRWHDRDFGRFPLRMDSAPVADSATRLLQVIGQVAKAAGRVEVPFEYIVPAAGQWWAGDSRRGLNVPIGRSGATKRQHLSLGQGTAQHGLIAGKTGSGKSTLLHALITNLALLYSPDEVELYLVDFKEGVEFKDYATFELPHARVVAIESEREFGLSVLQRLDAELRQRGERFRGLGVQDLAGYRQANGQTVLPRILLIVDEFQLFFIEDDKIAQDAALLLDRLVRQGRAFGIHVLLGSQTLGGAYTLARSTLGQMAVRIALQCSETDAHLILSDDNPAARLLSRPGEAIYNDANGLLEGNDFFQVVWLPDHQRETYLRRIQELARQRCHVASPPQIVFEGNAPADVSKNHLLNRLLQSTEPAVASRITRAWLGEALAIKDPTAAEFRPQSGRNLLLVGQFDEAAKGIMTTCLVSLASQHNGSTAFYVLDGSPVDTTHADFLKQVTDALPHPVHFAGWREALPVMIELAEEVERRLRAPEAESASLYLLIYGLQRFRDLRRPEDEFSFSRPSENAPPNPAKLFRTILREGPALGIYTIIWADTLNNVNHALDRQGLREFDMRVLFQMSAADSSALIDSPLAGKLGLHRALFYSEDRGQVEKFRPYGLPAPSWLKWVKQQLQAAAVQRS